MESSENSLPKPNRIKKKLIPWHCQQRYQTSLSQISFNHTLNKALYNRKIKSLLNNNRNLAKALERSRYELSDKENIQQNNANYIGIISFSSHKLREISDNLKKVTSCVDETFKLLQSHMETNPPKDLYCPSVNKSNFKNKIRAVSKAVTVEPLGVVTEENEPSMNDNKGPILSIEQTKKKQAKYKAKNTVPSTNKKDKLTEKKSKTQCLKAQTTITTPKITVRTNKPLVDNTPPSYLLGISSDSESFRNLIEQSKKLSKCNSTKKNAIPKRNCEQKHGLGPRPTSAISNSKIQQNKLDKDSTFIQSSKKKPKKVTGDKALSNNNKSASCKKAKVTSTQFGSEESQNSSKDSLSSIDEKSTESIEKSSSPSLETNLKALAITNEANHQPIAPNIKTHETSDNINIVQKDLQANTELGNLRVVLERDFMQRDTCVEKQTIYLNEVFDESDKLSPTLLPLKSSVKTTSSCQKEVFDESNRLSTTSLPLKSSVKTTSSCPKKVGFLLENDEIQMLGETQQPISKLKVKKTLKRPLKESTQNIPRKKQARPISALEAMEFKNKNTFTVTAEVHQPPDGYIPEKRPTVDNIHLFNMQPYVVLTDIFKSNNIVYEKVNYPACQVKEGPSTQKVEKEHTQVINLESSSCGFQANCNKENKIDTQNYLEARKQSRRHSKVSSYKELNLNVKMRRC